MMPENMKFEQGEIVALASRIVSAYLSKNATEAAAVPSLIQDVFTTLSALSGGEGAVQAEATPAVPVRKSITDDYLICLEDGRKLKMLKRHLKASYGMSPEEYRAKWGLKADYPMVAPNYALKRRHLAVKIGLGRKRPEPAPEGKLAGASKASSRAA